MPVADATATFEVLEGDRRRVEYRVDPAQAGVVRSIFTSYAAGRGCVLSPRN